MENSRNLEIKIKVKIESWFELSGDDFKSAFEEFCLGNRKSLKSLMLLLESLASHVFSPNADNLNKELLESLEYSLFDLLGAFSSYPGGTNLKNAINEKLIDFISDKFIEAKRVWNLNNFKISYSVEELDPTNSLIVNGTDPSERKDTNEEDITNRIKEQADIILKNLVVFAKGKFKGEKNRDIAVSWLENPERNRDIEWLASRSKSTKGCTKVILNRIKKTIKKNFELGWTEDSLILYSLNSPTESIFRDDGA